MKARSSPSARREKFRRKPWARRVSRSSANSPCPPDELPATSVAEQHSRAEDRRRLTVHAAQPARAIVELVKWIDQQGIGLADIHLKRPTLEDVFIELTGKKLRE